MFYVLWKLCISLTDPVVTWADTRFQLGEAKKVKGQSLVSESALSY